MNRIIRIGAAVLLVLAILIIAGNIVVRSGAFHRYLLATVIERAEKATGGRVEIGDVTIHWPGLSVDFYRVALHGTESEPDAPLFWSDHVRVGLTVISLWKREIDLSQVVVDHPVIHLRVDRQGQTNIPPTPPPAANAKPLDIFDLAIGRVAIHGGEIDYNDLQTPLDAEIRDLQTKVSFAANRKAYDGTIGYREGRVRFGDYRPVQHALEAEWEAAASGLTVKSLRLASGSSRVTAQASLRDYNNPSVEASYDAEIATSEVAEILKTDLPVARLSTKGSAHYRASPGQPFLAGLSIDGQLSSEAVAVASAQASASFRAVKAEYRLSQGNFEAHHVQAEALGGSLTADVSVQDLAGTPKGKIAGAIHGVSLSAANSALNAKPLEGTGISGRVDGTARATWRGSMQALEVRADATIAAEKPVGREPGAGRSVVPVDGTVHLAYDGDANVLTLQQSYLKTPHTTLNVEGTLAKRSSLRIQAQSDDLHEVDVLAAALMRPVPGRSQRPPAVPQPLGLGGSASFTGQLQGTMQNLRLTGQLNGQSVSYQQTTLRTIQTQLDASSSSIALHQGRLQTGSQGGVQFDVVAGLRNWSYEPRLPLGLRVVANNLAAADVERLANLQYPVSGVLSANIAVQGSESNPVGQGSLRLSGGRAWDQPIQDLAVQFDGNGTVVHATANVRTSAGSGSAKITYQPQNEGYDAQVDLPHLQLDRLQAVRAGNWGVSGFIAASARGQGTLKAPQLEASIEAPKLQIRQQALDGVKAHAAVTGQQATFTVESTVSGAAVQARGTVNLNAEYDTTASIDTQGFELGPLLSAYIHGRAADVHGRTELHGTLQGPLKYPERVEAHVVVPAINLSYQSVQLANAAPLRLDYRGGTLTLEPAELKGTGTDLQLHAVVPVISNGTMRGTATGTADLHILKLLNPDIDSSGQLKLDITAQGARNNPEIQGALGVVDGAFQMPDAPIGAEKVNAQFEVLKDRVNIKSFSAQSGGGTVTAAGFAVYRPSVQVSVALNAEDVRVRYPEGVRAVTTSDLTLNGTPSSALLSGLVLINRLSFTQSFDLDKFADQFTGPSSPPGEGIAQNIKLNVALKSTSEMDLASSKLSVTGSADLAVRGTAAEPVIVGRTNITGGEVFFNGRRYEVASGVIQFVNPVRTEPVVNLHVTTTVNQFNLTMNLAGPIDRMRTTYTSDPPLPPVDVINLLLTGQTVEAAAQNPSTPESVMAGQMAGEVSSRIDKLVGISSLTIDPQVGGTGTNSGTRLAIQQRVTKNLFFTFAQDVSSTQQDSVQVEYQVTHKYSLSTMRDQNGSYSLQVKVPKRF